MWVLFCTVAVGGGRVAGQTTILAATRIYKVLPFPSLKTMVNITAEAAYELVITTTTSLIAQLESRLIAQIHKLEIKHAYLANAVAELQGKVDTLNAD